MTPEEEGERWRRWARRAAPAVLVLALLGAPLLGRVRVDNRIGLWVDASDPAARSYERFRSTFGSDEFLLVAYEAPDPFSREALGVQRQVLERLEQLPHVRRVTGIPELHRDLFDGRNEALLERELRDTPFYRGFLVAPRGTLAGLLVHTTLPARAEASRRLVHGVEAALEPFRARGWRVHLVGPPVLNAALDEISGREALRTFPVAVAASVVMLLVLFRCARTTAVACTCAAVTLILTVSGVALSGRSLNMVSAVLPALLWVLTLAGSVHLLSRFRARRAYGDAPGAALAVALTEAGPPGVLSAVTTSLGFASLLGAGMQPVRELGAFAAVGILIGLAVNLSVGPWLLERLRVRTPPVRRPAPAGTPFAVRRSGPLLVVSAGVVVATLATLPRIRVESDPLAFLPADSRVVRDYAAVGRELTGFYSLEVVIRSPRGWLDPAVWGPVDSVADALAAEPAVAHVLSPLDVLRQVHYWTHGRDPARYRLPADAAEARELVDTFDPLGGGERSGLVADGGHALRLSALLRVMPASEFLAVRDAARRALAALPAPLDGEVTGLVLQLVDAQLDLVASQLRSFAAAFVTVFLCIAVGLRSLRAMLVSILPNLLPVLAALAAMALVGIPLDPATVMMASVALGIAVDDTVHVLSAFARARRAGDAVREAVGTALAEVRPALVVTTVAACIGFLALGLSDFVPIRCFGLLSALALAVALAADLLVLPALLVRGAR